MFNLPIATATPFASDFYGQNKQGVDQFKKQTTIANIPRGAAGDRAFLVNFNSAVPYSEYMSWEKNYLANPTEAKQMKEEKIDPMNDAQIISVAQGLVASEGLTTRKGVTTITRDAPGKRVGYMHLDRDSANTWVGSLKLQQQSQHEWMRPTQDEIVEVEQYVKSALSGDRDASHARGMALWVRQKAREAKISSAKRTNNMIPVVLQPGENPTVIAKRHGVSVNDVVMANGSRINKNTARNLKAGETLYIPEVVYSDPTPYQIRLASSSKLAEGAVGENSDYSTRANIVMKEVNERARKSISK